MCKFFAELLSELARREKYAGIFPEPEVDLFMKVNTSWELFSRINHVYLIKHGSIEK